MAWNQDFGEGANPGSGYEQQSWRDSYNGGRAAGDWTGNTNARLDSERDRFQGATWSGSSSQPSALELARSFVGPGQSGGVNAAGPTGTGAGNGAVRQVAPRTGSLTFSGAGAGHSAVLSGPLTPKVKDSASGGWAGMEFFPNPWFSDVENWWEPRYGEPGEWLGGLVNIAADGVYNGLVRGGVNTDKIARDVGAAFQQDYWANSAAVLSGRVAESPWWEVNASARRGADGRVYRTGGGF